MIRIRDKSIRPRLTRGEIEAISDNEIRVRLPETQVLAWMTSAQVSIEGEQLLDNGR